MAVRDIDQEDFEDILRKNKGKLVVVEFYTRTCPVCAAMVPIFEEVSSFLEKDAVFLKIDANANQSLSMRFGIMGVPAFKYLCNGREVAGSVGETNVTILTNTIKDLVKRGQECISKSTVMRYEMDGYG